MKLHIITPTGAFRIEGSDSTSIINLISAPPWVATAIKSWLENDGQGEHTVHFAPGYAVIVPQDEQRELEQNEILRKFQTYSDYHKDFYGHRPIGVSHLSPRQIAHLYDKIAAKHVEMQQTREGRDKLRANGWLVEEPAEKPPARKVAAKKAARRK